MALRTIVKEGDRVLNKVARPVDKFDEKLKVLVEDMKDTLLAANGVGLAAPQVGISRRLCIVEDEGDENKMIVLVNPEIISAEGEQEFQEGCLSLPGVWGKTKRPEWVTVRAFDENGKEFEITRTGITAVCFCHEIDHLNGILFREHVYEYVEVE